MNSSNQQGGLRCAAQFFPFCFYFFFWGAVSQKTESSSAPEQKADAAPAEEVNLASSAEPEAGEVTVGEEEAAEEKSDEEEKEEWDVSAPPLETRKVELKVTEGTWMNLDVSPDGQTIVFDLLGDIYTLPISGGAATNISSGLAYEAHPRFSPDGSMIAFTSDRDGGDNIWIMDADGENKRQVTKEKFRLLNNPTWHPDGKSIAAKKHFTTGRSLGDGRDLALLSRWR